MMPDLGKYEATVLWSYVAGLALIAVLVVWTIWRAGRVKRALAEAEARQNG